MVIDNIHQQGIKLERYESYKLIDMNIIPIGKSYSVDVFENSKQKEILSDFMKLIQNLHNQAKLMKKSKTKLNDYIKKDFNQKIAKLIHGFVQEHGHFGIYEDRVVSGFPDFDSNNNISEHFFLPRINSAFPYRTNILDGEIDDGLPEGPGGPISEDEYLTHFPFASNNPLDRAHAILGTGPGWGETIQQIINNSRFVQVSKHIIQSKNKHIDNENDDGLPPYFEVESITGMFFSSGQLKYNCKSLIEAISVMYLMNLLNQNNERQKLCSKKGCSNVFTAKIKSNRNLEKQYCCDKCKAAAGKARYRKRIKEKEAATPI